MDELRAALELATEEELDDLTKILFCRRFNPLDYWQTPEPIEIKSQDWHSWLDSLESRFRYLAADGFTVLRGQSKHISYRQILIRVCLFLKIPYSQELSTVDLEGEIFLFLASKAWKQLSPRQKQSITERVKFSLAQSHLSEPLPVQLQHDPINLLLKGGSVWAISSVLKSWLLKQVAHHFALHFASYQTAKTTLIRGGVMGATQLKNHLALQTAKRGMAVNAARYGALRSVFAFVGPLLWGWLIIDLGWRAIATNYTRVIPVIFTLAQIRLTRSESWELLEAT